MNIDERELKLELEHLEYAKDVIKSIIASKNVDIEDYKKSIVDRKRFLWEHKSEIFDVDLNVLMDEEDLNVTILNKDIVKVYKLYRSLETPYFSRIDFERDGSKETFYIGLTGIDKDYEPIVYDWRANVSNLYYNYGMGASQYVTGDGEVIAGKTVLKRQFEIQMGTLLKAYDSELDSHDELLETVLRGNTSDQMRNIVSTIQKEQNEIIRYNGTSTLTVEGVAGSGKTSVALHRISYLLYNQKGITNKNILIFSPSEVFTNYISNVLPELGEENVLSTTFNEFAKSYIKGRRIESLVEFIERYYEEGGMSYGEVQAKLDGRDKTKLDEFLKAYFKSKKFKKKIGLKKEFITSEELNALKDKLSDTLTINDRIVALSETLCARFSIDEKRNAAKLQRKIYEMLEIETDPVKLYEEYLGRVVGETVHYEDIFGILYLHFEVMGYPSFGHIKFVVIDEAQDYTLWQFAFLKKIFNRAVFTILGDKNQRINPFLKYDSLKEIAAIFQDSKYKYLKNTYRSSKEIIDYSNEILGLKGINSIRPSNDIAVEEKRGNDLSKTIRQFKDLGFERIAVITKTREEIDFLKSYVSDDVTFIPVYLSKGLEFDAVIIYTKEDNCYKGDERNVFYVAATRGLHALSVYNQKPTL